ncbi:MAG: GFA family protein [Pseudomonadales bacterium]|jgi:hypothetical protein
MMTSYQGHCLCGQVSYEISEAPQMAGICHCKNCQRQAGSAFSTLWGVAKSAFTLRGESLKCYIDAETDSGAAVERHFCGHCGSPIYSALPGTPDTIFLKTGTLDDTGDFAPQFHVWCDSKQSWVDIPADQPQMAKQ